MIYPMFALIILTFAVAFYLMTLRIRSVKQGKVSVGYFRVYTGEPPPVRVQQAANHYSNLFEVPLLFYITCLAALVFNAYTPLMLTLAWLFVASRVVHTGIHLTYNNVVHRLGAFLLGIIILLVMWVLMAIR